MAAGATYVSIASTTLGSTASTVTFSSIAGTYTDLVIIVSAMGIVGSGAGANTNFLRFNGDTSSVYSDTRLAAGGSVSSSANTGAGSMNLGNGNEANTDNLIYSPHIYNIMNYSNATTYKTVLANYHDLETTGQRVGAVVGLWRSTSAVTSVTIYTDSSNYRVGSTFSLYGITAA